MNRISIESTKSHIVSLKSVNEHTADLSSRRKQILDKIPCSGNYAIFEKEYLNIKDLAYLTAKTGDEFAWLTGKTEDILFHGTKYNCSFDEKISEDLKKHKYYLEAHSHPDEDNPFPSIPDRNTLMLIDQKQSKIISATSLRVVSYTGNQCLDYLLD